jgi:hypothetical protein
MFLGQLTKLHTTVTKLSQTAERIDKIMYNYLTGED